MRASYIRYGIKEFERNIFFNIFIILQISAALILIVYCVSSINYISKFYSPIKEHIDGEGICSIDIQNYPLLEEISGFEYVDEVYSFNSVGGLYNNSNAFYKNDIRYVYINSYDDKFINDYIPILEKGKWLSECDSEDGIINAVISYSDEYEWFCQYHLTHFIRTRIMQRERYDHSRAFFGLPESDHRWRCRFFC